ncbi:MAG: hypothetical protein V7707_20120 [Motiliproteus sp.]
MYHALPTPHVSQNFKWSATLSKTAPESAVDGVKVVSFSPSYSHGLHGNPIDELFNNLFPKVENRCKTSYSQAFKSSLLALAQANQSSTPDLICGFIHSRSTARKKVIDRYKVCAYSTTVFLTMLNALVECGFVTYENGFRNWKQKRSGVGTLWLTTPAFSDWVSENGSMLSVVQHFASTESIIRKSANDKKKIDYDDTPEIEGMRQRVEASNALRLQYAWSYHPLSDALQFVEGIEQVSIPASDLTCKRVFNGDFKSGGRFHCGAQYLKKLERGPIAINGQPTVELDYKSLHPRLLYNAEGLVAPVDCYASDSSRPRDLTKQASLLSINCKSFDQARKALVTKAKISSDEAKRHLADYAQEHPAIAHRFYGSGWSGLQYLDSQLVDAVLAKATEVGIPVLPVHDSFIAATEHGFWLKDAVTESYKALMGFDAVIDWELAPDQEAL